jgi:hypothetical protein
MTNLSTGMLVRHASLGVGKVVAVEPTAVHVFFPDDEKRFAAKLRLATVRPMLATDGIERDPWLEGLSSFSFDETSGRYALGANWVTHDQAITELLAAHPRGFADGAPGAPATGPRERANRWRTAGAAWAAALGEGAGEKLVAAGDVAGLVRKVVGLERHLALVPGTFEKGALAEALRDEEAAAAFFEALFSVLAVPSPGRARFEALFSAVEAMEVPPALAWPLATVFPFLADPSRHLILWPRIACTAAERLGCDLRFDPVPSWPAYAALRGLATRLLETLAPHGATDLADVEAFLYVTSRPRTAAAKRAAQAAQPPARPARGAAKTTKSKRSA